MADTVSPLNRFITAEEAVSFVGGLNPRTFTGGRVRATYQRFRIGEGKRPALEIRGSGSPELDVGQSTILRSHPFADQELAAIQILLAKILRPRRLSGCKPTLRPSLP